MDLEGSLQDSERVLNTADGHFCRCKWLIDNARLNQPVLDIGCSDGFMFRDSDVDVVETDIAFIFPDEYLYKVKFIKADAQYLPFKNKQFKCSVLGDMLEHVVNPVKVIAEAMRVSVSVYISVPNEWEWDVAQRPFQHADHKRFYTKQRLIRDIESAVGFNKITELCKINGGGWSFYCVEVS